jgi:NAD(P)H-dependent flavin oxidoreductase YrpB (nitropropane dioxygenase family)
VSSGRAASIITQKWQQNYNYLPDAFVVEGPKAGGHLGFKSETLQDASNKLENLVDEVVKVASEIKEKFNKDVPVIAAGGLYTGKDIHSIMKHGATGVQLGTRFVATEECDAAQEFKQAVVDATEKDIQIIKSPVGMPGRSIFNRFLQEASDGQRRPKFCKHNCIRSCNPKTTLYCISEALVAAFKGNLKDGFAFVGSNAGRIKKISTVKEIFIELQEEYRVAENT